MSLSKIAVLGLDDFNRKNLESLLETNGRRTQIVKALSIDELKSYMEDPIESLLDLARERLKEEKIDGLITWWDFPGTLMQAILNREFGLVGFDLESALRCEHKYWSRLKQRKVIPDATPRFRVIDPFDPPLFADLDLEAPFWIKPIKSTASMLGFEIEDAGEYSRALETIQDSIKELGRPFNEILKHAEIPGKLAGIDGNTCLLEESCRGSQHTVSGYIYNRKIHIYGLIDSINYKERPSFLCYTYPSRLDKNVCQRISEISKRIMRETGLNNSAFNIEYFYDKERDKIHLLEINPRISQSHSDIYHKVDGTSNMLLILDLAAGKEPDYEYGQGNYSCAAKFYLRYFEDGVVKRIPTEEEIKDLQKEYPGLLVNIEPHEGMRLSDSIEQDSYSYILAMLFIGADSFDELFSKYEEIAKALPFEIEPL